MRQFPNEIEADLLFRGVDVHDWHQGRMSSRRLLALVDSLPPESAYWRERRDGDWSLEEYVRAATVNEIRLLRADQAAIHADHKMDINMINSPAQDREHEELVEAHHTARSMINAQLYKKTE